MEPRKTSDQNICSNLENIELVLQLTFKASLKPAEPGKNQTWKSCEHVMFNA